MTLVSDVQPELPQAGETWEFKSVGSAWTVLGPPLSNGEIPLKNVKTGATGSSPPPFVESLWRRISPAPSAEPVGTNERCAGCGTANLYLVRINGILRCSPCHEGTISAPKPPEPVLDDAIKERLRKLPDVERLFEKLPPEPAKRKQDAETCGVLAKHVVADMVKLNDEWVERHKAAIRAAWTTDYTPMTSPMGPGWSKRYPR